MASSSEIAQRYFDAMSRKDLQTACTCWAESGVERIVGQQELVGPSSVREYFGTLFRAFPDWRFEVLAALKPSAAWAGHTDPVTGDVVGQLEHAADTAPTNA